MGIVNITVNGASIQAEKGGNLLEVCLKNNIYIPNLCYMEGMEEPPASCRLCLVEIDGLEGPVTACSTKVREGLVVRTESKLVRELQRSALRLLLSSHQVDCANCEANKRCGLQEIARFLGMGLKPRGLDQVLKGPDRDDSHPYLVYYSNRCVLCGKCIYICKREHPHPMLSFANRGFDTVVSLYGASQAKELPCIACSQCVEICPVGALTRKRVDHRQHETRK